MTGTLPDKSLHRAVLLSDGASRLVDPFELATWEELLELLDESGPDELLRQVRAAEAIDPEGRQWPRTNAATTPPPCTSPWMRQPTRIPEQAAWDGRRAALAGGSLVLRPRPGWRDLAGRCWHARPPAASTPPTNPAPEPTHGRRVLMHGRLRWLHRLPLVASRHATVSTVPRFQGQGRPPGQATGRGSTMTEASVSFAGDLTDDPSSGTPRAGSPGQRSGWRSSGRREQEPSFFTVLVWRDQAEHAGESLRRAAGSWSWADSSSGAGQRRMAAPAPPWRSWPRSWGRASGGRRRRRPGSRRAVAHSDSGGRSRHRPINRYCVGPPAPLEDGSFRTGSARRTSRLQGCEPLPAVL